MQLVYFDESGNLGNKFTGPASSQSCRFLTIAFLSVPQDIEHIFKRIVKDAYNTEFNVKHPSGNKIEWDAFKKIELKGSSLSDFTRLRFISKISVALAKHPETKLFAITVDKSKCSIQDWENDRNLLYNYMVGIALKKNIGHYDDYILVPDPRSIKTGSVNSLFDYVTIKLKYEERFNISISHRTIPSERSLNLQCIDFLSNIIWRSYERNENHVFPLLKPNICDLTELFFRKHNNH